MNVAIIPARGGSKRIPRKNIRPFFGVPMIAYSIEVAIRSGLFRAVCVSTEDPEIAQVARHYGAEVINRLPELAEIGAPDCGTQEVTRDALLQLIAQGRKFDYACCIYPTAPLLHPAEIERGYEALLAHPHFFYSYAVGPDRKDAGMFYWGMAWSFLTRAPLSSVCSWRCVIDAEHVCDINTELDWCEAERKYAALHGIERTETDYHPV